MRNEYLDRLVSSSETDVRGELNKFLTDSPAENYLYSRLGFLISDHLRLDHFWNPNDQWIDATGFLETEILTTDALRIIGYFNWGYMPQASNGNYAPLDATLTLHPDGRLDYDIRTTIDGRPRLIRPDGIHFPANPEDFSVGPRPELFLRILREKPTGEDPYFITPPGSGGLRMRIDDDRERDFQKLATAAFCLGLTGPEGESALRALLHAKPTDLLPALLQAGADLQLSDPDFVEFCLECIHSTDEDIREAALFGLYFAEEGIHPSLIASYRFLWARLTTEKKVSLNSMWRERVIADILAASVARNAELGSILLEALMNHETADLALKVFSEMDESVGPFVPALISFLDSETSRKSNLAHLAFKAIQKAGPEIALPILLTFLKRDDVFYPIIAARTFRKMAKETPTSEIIGSALENALFTKGLTVQVACELVKAAAGFGNPSPGVKARVGEVISSLLTVVENQELRASQKTEIVKAIGKTGEFSTDAAPRLLNYGRTLVQAQQNRDKHRSWFSEDYLLGEIVKVLGKLGNSKPELIEFLKSCLIDPEANQQLDRKGGESLVQIGLRGHEILLELLKKTNDWHLEHRILWAFHRKPDSPITLIKGELENQVRENFDSRYCLRLLNCLLFSKRLGPDLIPILLALLRRPEEKIRLIVTDLLERAGDSSEQVIGALTLALQDENPEVACRARQSFRKLNLL